MNEELDGIRKVRLSFHEVRMTGVIIAFLGFMGMYALVCFKPFGDFLPPVLLCVFFMIFGIFFPKSLIRCPRCRGPLFIGSGKHTTAVEYCPRCGEWINWYKKRTWFIAHRRIWFI